MSPPAPAAALRSRRARRPVFAIPLAVLALATGAPAAVVVRGETPSGLQSVAGRLHGAVAEVRHPVEPGSQILSTYGAAALLPNGMAVTTVSAIGNARSVVVSGAGGFESPAQVVGTFPTYGLAVLRLEQVPNVPVPSEYAVASPGQQLIVLGSGDDAVTILGVTALTPNGDLFGIGSAKMIVSRFWGGPLLDSAGRLVGICLPSPAQPVAVSAPTLKAIVGRFVSSR